MLKRGKKVTIVQRCTFFTLPSTPFFRIFAVNSRKIYDKFDMDGTLKKSPFLGRKKKVQAFWKNVDADTANVLINYENNS